MGLGNWGTILLVIAVAWGAWTFFLSPTSEASRDIGGGLFDLVTNNGPGFNSKIEKYTSRVKSACPVCQNKPVNQAACTACVERNKSKIIPGT